MVMAMYADDLSAVGVAGLVAHARSAVGRPTTLIGLVANSNQGSALADLGRRFDVRTICPANVAEAAEALDAARFAPGALAVLPIRSYFDRRLETVVRTRVIVGPSTRPCRGLLLANGGLPPPWSLSCEVGGAETRGDAAGFRTLPVRLPCLGAAELASIASDRVGGGLGRQALLLAAVFEALAAEPDADRLTPDEMSALLSEDADPEIRDGLLAFADGLSLEGTWHPRMSGCAVPTRRRLRRTEPARVIGSDPNGAPAACAARRA